MAKSATSKTKSEKRSNSKRKSSAATKDDELKTDVKAESTAEGDSKSGAKAASPAAGNGSSVSKAETGAGAPAAAGQQRAPNLQALGQYIRDFSFENIMVQKSLNVRNEVRPDINVEVALDAKRRPNAADQYEVLTKYSISSKITSTNDTLFLLELEYCGIFRVQNVPNDRLHPLLMIECPRMLFPFVRRIVADMTREGGFPPLALDAIDFVALYRQMLQRNQEQQAKQ